MNLTLIAAVSRNNVIGSNGKLPWHIPEDMKKFKELTIGHPVIMGRKTYESIPKNFRQLPGRKKIILSNSLEDKEGIYVARDVIEALDLTESEESYIIGGESVYKSFMHMANRLEITRVHRDFEGDSFFPKIDLVEWSLIDDIPGISRPDMLSYSFQTYIRK